ncbi:hypothetical protein J6I39_01065 [bacterium]|nr:hypothetical protein [bacterium]
MSIWKFHNDILLMLGTIVLIIYIIPPLITRVALLICPLKNTEYELFSKEYYVWWLTFCSQIIYLRLSFLEEFLRIIPGLYSMWLRICWGAKIGKLTFWAPGTRILERNFLEIGDNVIFAADTRINAHVQTDKKLLIAPVIIEDNVVVGAYSLLTCGTVLKSNQATKAFLISPPFSVWKDGARVKNAD